MQTRRKGLTRSFCYWERPLDLLPLCFLICDFCFQISSTVAFNRHSRIALQAEIVKCCRMGVGSCFFWNEFRLIEMWFLIELWDWDCGWDSASGHTVVLFWHYVHLSLSLASLRYSKAKLDLVQIHIVHDILSLASQICWKWAGGIGTTTSTSYLDTCQVDRVGFVHYSRMDRYYPPVRTFLFFPSKAILKTLHPSVFFSS